MNENKNVRVNLFAVNFLLSIDSYVYVSGFLWLKYLIILKVEF